MPQTDQFLNHFVNTLGRAAQADVCLLYRVNEGAELALEADYRSENLVRSRGLHEQLAARALRHGQLASATYPGAALELPGGLPSGTGSVTSVAMPVFLADRVVGILVLQTAAENRHILRLAARVSEMAREALSLPILKVVA
jgi:hypothetical protein